MKHVVKQWTARALSLCVIGPLCAWIASGVIAIDGTHQTTLLTGNSIATSMMSLVGVLGLVMVMGVCIGRCIDRREGILNMAFVLGWVAWTGGRVGEVFRISADTGTMLKLAIEGLVLMLGVLIALGLMTNPKSNGTDGQPDEVSRFDAAYIKSSFTGSAGIISLGAALIASVLVSVLFGQSDLPGQAVGVGFFAGIAGGLAGAFASTSAKKNDRHAGPSAFAPMMVGVMLCAVLMPIVGIGYPGVGKLAGLVNIGDLPGFLIVSPSAWVMGALLGVPVGHSWVEHSSGQAASSAAKA